MVLLYLYAIKKAIGIFVKFRICFLVIITKLNEITYFLGGARVHTKKAYAHAHASSIRFSILSDNYIIP